MRKLAVVLSLLAVFLVACTSGDDGANERQDEAIEQPGTAAAAPTSVTEPTAVPEPTAEPQSVAEDGALEGFLDPLSLLTGPLFSGAGPGGLQMATGEADPVLKAALLTLEDLPSGYEVLEPGGMSFSFETDEGSVSMAMSMFSQGDMVDAFPESMVMSAVMAGSGDLLDQSLGELRRFMDGGDLEQEIQEALGPGDLLGIGLEDLRVLDASDLGDGGIGLHVVVTMDLEQFGDLAISGDNPLAGGLAMDMYVFLRSDTLLMLMSMWPGDGPPPVDARALAELMDARAKDAF